MEEQPSWARSPETTGNREIDRLNSKIRTLEMRIESLNAQIPNSNIVSPKFWTRALAVFGHQMAIVLVMYATIFAIAIFFGIIGAIIGR